MVLLSSGTIFAQTNKGNFVLSGGTSLQFISGTEKYTSVGEMEDETKTTSLTFVPSFAYFVIDNLAIGLNGNIMTSTEKYDSGSKNVVNTIMIIPSALYYFPMEGKIRPLIQIGAGWASMSDKYIPKTGASDKNSGHGLVLNFGGGIAYFINENVSCNFGLS